MVPISTGGAAKILKRVLGFGGDSAYFDEGLPEVLQFFVMVLISTGGAAKILKRVLEFTRDSVYFDEGLPEVLQFFCCGAHFY